MYMYRIVGGIYIGRQPFKPDKQKKTQQTNKKNKIENKQKNKIENKQQNKIENKQKNKNRKKKRVLETEYFLQKNMLPLL